jgi:broad specificity phosphatase PhoE
MAHVTFYLVRHGQSESNALGLLSSYPEVPGRTVRHLTEQGISEVKETAEKLRQENIDVIIASPLTRTVETAAIISEATGIPVLQDIRLRETNFGIYDAGPVERFFNAYSKPEERILTDGGDGVESFEDMRARVVSILDDVKRECDGKKVVLVSHADTLEQIHGVLVGENVRASAIGWSPKTGSMLKIESI